jgi:predicted NodU family carbamoyl transferase
MEQPGMGFGYLGREALGERREVTCLEHHHSHAARAYYGSPYEEAAVLTVDGVGEQATTSILNAYLGFEVNEGE